MIFTHGYWIWYLILWSNVFCWGQIAIVVLTILRTHFTKKILLVPGVLAILTAIVHSYTLKSWRKTVVHRVLANYPQVIFSHTLAVINGCFAIAWFVVSIIMYIFATTLLRRRTPDADGVDLLYDIPPILFWLSAFAAYMLFTTAFALASTGLYYRHRFLKRSQRPVGYKPPRQLLTSSHTKWIMASIVLSLVACTLDLGVSLGDGWFGGYSLWLIPACTGITLLFQFITLSRWRKTAKQRWGTTTPLAISSITLPILLFPLASLWTATAIFSFLVAARKYSVRRYVFRASQYRRYTVFMYTRWIAAGLAMLVAVLIWLEFALVVYSRATYAKRLAHARQTTTGTTSSGGGGGGGGTGYEAHNNNNQGSNFTTKATNVHPELLTGESSASMKKAELAIPTPPPSYPNENSYPINNLYPANNLYPTNNAYPVVNNAYPAQTNSMYNPVYQAPTMPPPSASGFAHPVSMVNPMYQKDEGKA